MGELGFNDKDGIDDSSNASIQCEQAKVARNLNDSTDCLVLDDNLHIALDWAWLALCSGRKWQDDDQRCLNINGTVHR